MLRALSGAPFSLIDSSFDLDQNGLFENEWLTPGSYRGEGEDAIGVENEGGRMGARGPAFFQLDLRGGYRFRLQDRYIFEAFVEVLNVTNRANFENPAINGRADLRRTDFLVLTGLEADGPTRTMQIGLRWEF